MTAKVRPAVSPDPSKLCACRSALAVEHGRNRKKPLAASTLAFVVVEEFKISFP